MMIYKLSISCFIFCLLFCSVVGYGQNEEQGITIPKLAVGIVVDQMGYELLYKFQAKYGPNGFNRLINDGYSFENHRFNYIPTVTAAGHASIYTGATPSVHGIINNTWYSREAKKLIDNVSDRSVRLLGIERNDIAGSSPQYLMTTTIGDQLKASNKKSKVISVSLKDRAAILPGGKDADAAYWYDWNFSPGHFVSSSYYMKRLPKWVTAFNKKEWPNTYLDSVWTPLYPVASYTESAADDNPYERAIGGKASPTFPYNFSELREAYKTRNAEYQLMLIAPAGNTLLTDFAMEAIKQEELGTDTFTDLLSISYSVPDVIGHTFGPQSVEMADVMLRLDKEIEKLLNFLDSEFGRDDYILFLTADHGAGPPASQLADLNKPTGIVSTTAYQDSINLHLAKTYGRKAWVEYFDTESLFLRRELIEAENLDLSILQNEVSNYLETLDGVKKVMTAEKLKTKILNDTLEGIIQNGFYPDRSGDLMLVYDPGTLQTRARNLTMENVKGSVHGSPYEYDTHVPLIWFGKGIKKGSSKSPVSPTDIAPTLSRFLNLEFLNGMDGEVLTDLFDD